MNYLEAQNTAINISTKMLTNILITNMSSPYNIKIELLFNCKEGEIKVGKEIVSVKNVMDIIVPITRFNRGEASKIFYEVNECGVKVVLKNNTPACVLVKPEKYEEMVEALEDYALYFEAERRMEKAKQEGFLKIYMLNLELAKLIWITWMKWRSNNGMVGRIYRRCWP